MGCLERRPHSPHREKTSMERSATKAVHVKEVGGKEWGGGPRIILSRVFPKLHLYRARHRESQNQLLATQQQADISGLRVLERENLESRTPR